MPYFSSDYQAELCRSIDQLHMAKILYDSKGIYFPDEWSFVDNDSEEANIHFFIKTLTFSFNGTTRHDEDKDVFENEYGERAYMYMLEYPELAEFHQVRKGMKDPDMWLGKLEAYFEELEHIESDWNCDASFEATTDGEVILFQFNAGYYMFFAPALKLFFEFHSSLKTLIKQMKEGEHFGRNDYKVRAS